MADHNVLLELKRQFEHAHEEHGNLFAHLVYVPGIPTEVQFSPEPDLLLGFTLRETADGERYAVPVTTEQVRPLSAAIVEFNRLAVLATMQLVDAKMAMEPNFSWVQFVFKHLEDAASHFSPEIQTDGGTLLTAGTIFQSNGCIFLKSADLLEEAAKPPTHRLQVDLSKSTVVFDGTVHDVSSPQALRWLAVLADDPGQWVSSSDLEAANAELVDVRTDRLRQALPKPIQSLVESKPGRGSRLKLA